MPEIRLTPGEAAKKLELYSANPGAPEFKSWKGNTVVVGGSLTLGEKHTQLPPQLVVEGDIKATKSGVKEYRDLTCYGSLELEGNKNVLHLRQSAVVKGSMPAHEDSAQDRVHKENARRHGVHSPGNIHIGNVPQKMETLHPKCSGFMSAHFSAAIDVNVNGVGDLESRGKWQQHFSESIIQRGGNKTRSSQVQSGNTKPSVPGQELDKSTGGFITRV